MVDGEPGNILLLTIKLNVHDFWVGIYIDTRR